MGKRYEHATNASMLRAIEESTGRQFNDSERRLIVRGPDEHDLVNSGLEETMVGAYNEILDIRRKRNIPTLRAAAFVDAIDKVARSYAELGIFP
jgi:glutamate dehydrogenase (NAD(P)+)